MKTLLLVLLLVFSTVGLSGQVTGDTTYHLRMVIPAKAGGITFQHFRHAQRVNFNCGVCHPGIWPQNASAQLGYKGHATDPDKQAACGECHSAHGKAGMAPAAKEGCNTFCHTQYAGGGEALQLRKTAHKSAPAPDAVTVAAIR
jgi:hypothetical protein